MEDEERKLDSFAFDLLERMGERWPELEWDKDGPIDQAAWLARWDKVQSAVDSYMNAVPVKA